MAHKTKKDYAMIYFEYLSSNDTIEEIAKRHGLNSKSLRTHFSRNGLVELRKTTFRESRKKFINSIASKLAKRQNKAANFRVENGYKDLEKIDKILEQIYTVEDPEEMLKRSALLPGLIRSKMLILDGIFKALQMDKNEMSDKAREEVKELVTTIIKKNATPESTES